MPTPPAIPTVPPLPYRLRPCSRRPIHDQQAWNAFEFARVRSDERRPAAARLSGDQIVIGADRRSLRFEHVSDVSRVRGVIGFEGRDDYASKQQLFELQLRRRRAVALGVTVA